MTAQIVLAAGNPGPVNDGERRVLQHLAEHLPDGFELHPNLQVTVMNAQMVEVDIVVFGPDCMWVVEVKDLAGDVRVSEHGFTVNGEPRSHPVFSTRLKAQKIKSRLSVNPALSDVWIQPVVVLARQPARLDVADAMRPHVVSIERAVQVIGDPSLIGLHRNRLPDAVRAVAKARLAVDTSVRATRSRFGEYDAVEVLASGGGVVWWRGRHHLLGNEVLLEVQAHDPLAGNSAEAALRASRLRAVQVGQRLGAHPNLLAPVTGFIGDDGSLVIVHPMSPNPTLETIDIDSLDDDAKRRVVNGVALLLALCKRRGVAHRILGPSVIHVGPLGEARVAGFGAAKMPTGNGLTVAPVDWSIHGEFWSAPEHNGGEVGHEADLFALGKLISHLWPDGAPVSLATAAETLTVPNPADRGPSAVEVARLAKGEVQAPPAAAGMILDARYVLERQLGAGAFAAVWAATDSLTGDRVALKIFESADAGDQVYREYRALEGLNDRAIVRVRDIARVDGKWALVTELLEGPDLRAYMLDQGRLPVSTVVPIALRLLSGLRSIHPDLDAIREAAGSAHAEDGAADRLAELQSTGIIHRDVKPENVILVEGRGPVLVDFGLAAGAGGGVSGGTMAYRPPDVAGDGSDPDVDLFAMGVVLHELLTGEHPYTERNPLTGEYVPSDELVGSIGEIVKRACAPRRDQRFGSTAEFIGALGALGIADVEIEVPVLGIVERLRAIEAAMSEQRWDDALELCDAEWVPIRERIERRRALAEAGEENPPVFDAHGFSISVASTGRFDVASDTGGVEHGPGSLSTYLVKGPSGELLEVLQFRADDGAVWVTGGDTFQTPPPLQRIGRALRLGSQHVGDGLMLELRMPRVNSPDGWSNVYQVTLKELEDASGIDVRSVLISFGGIEVGTRAEVIGDTSNRRNTLCVLARPDAEHLPAIAHFVTRVLPLGRTGE